MRNEDSSVRHKFIKWISNLSVLQDQKVNPYLLKFEDNDYEKEYWDYEQRVKFFIIVPIFLDQIIDYIQIQKHRTYCDPSSLGFIWSYGRPLLHIISYSNIWTSWGCICSYIYYFIYFSSSYPQIFSKQTMDSIPSQHSLFRIYVDFTHNNYLKYVEIPNHYSRHSR